MSFGLVGGFAENLSTVQAADNREFAFQDSNSVSRRARRKDLLPSKIGWGVMSGTGMRTGLVAHLISTLKNEPFLGACTGIVMGTNFPRGNLISAASAKRCVVVVVSDKVGFAFIAA